LESCDRYSYGLAGVHRMHNADLACPASANTSNAPARQLLLSLRWRLSAPAPRSRSTTLFNSGRLQRCHLEHERQIREALSLSSTRKFKRMSRGHPGEMPRALGGPIRG